MPVSLATLAVLLILLTPRQVSAQQVAPYSTSSIWAEQGFGRDTMLERCAEFVGALDPRKPEDAACIVTAMQERGADESAIRFFSETEEFLIQFDERGTVDLGAAAAPWFNMGRPHLVFLNGLPPVLGLGRVVPRDWQDQSGYQGPAFPWPEYAEVSESSMQPDGTQTFSILVPLRECRACPEVGVLPIEAHFDAEGTLSRTKLSALVTVGR